MQDLLLIVGAKSTKQFLSDPSQVNLVHHSMISVVWDRCQRSEHSFALVSCRDCRNDVHTQHPIQTTVSHHSATCFSMLASVLGMHFWTTLALLALQSLRCVFDHTLQPSPPQLLSCHWRCTPPPRAFCWTTAWQLAVLFSLQKFFQHQPLPSWEQKPCVHHHHVLVLVVVVVLVLLLLLLQDDLCLWYYH